jgi:phosphoribosyl-ATP pyrophosphohydrolase
MPDEHPIDHLYATIVARKGTDPKRSYTAKLLKAGVAQCAKKLGEEGVEAALAGVAGKKKEIVSESADVLYHLLVLWVATGVKPKSVYDALQARQARSGLAEKNSRKRVRR